MNDEIAVRLIMAIERVADELKLTREMTENCSGTKINDFNLKQIEALTGGGGLVRAGVIVGAGGGPPPKMS